MAIRARLLQGATALLYFGPLLAGMAGFGWAMLPPFVSIFVFWLMLLRPHQWPQRNRDWLSLQILAGVATIVLTQVLLVAVLFGIGRGIGGVAGHLPMFHPFLPLGLSFLALPLSRLVWNAERAAARGVRLDEVLYPPAAAEVALPAELLPVLAPVGDEVRPLLDMADDTPLAIIGPAFEDVLDEADAWQRLTAIAEALELAPDRHRALREALVIWATEPEHFAANTTPAGLRVAFRAVAGDPDLLRLLLPRAAVLARLMPDRHGQFPDRAALEALGKADLPGQIATDYAALMAALGYRPAKAKARARARIGQTLPT